MALALKRVRGQDLVFAITGGGTITAIRDLKLNQRQGTFEANAADAVYEQKTLGRKTADGTYTMWLGTEGVAPSLGATISLITASVGADEVGPATIDDATVYGTCKVTSIGHSFQDTPATIDVGFEMGFI